MAILNNDPADIFNTDNPNVTKENINNFIVPVVHLSDSHGDYLAIPAIDQSLSDICGTIVLGHFIKEIDYDHYNGKPAVIKAYF